MTAEDCYVESLEDAAADMNGLKNTRYVDRWMKKYGQWTPNSLCTMSRIWGALSTDDWNQPRLGARAYIPAAGEMIAIAPYWGQIKQAFYDCFGRTPADGQYWTSTHRPYNGGTAAYGNFVESGGEWSFELIDNTQYNTDNKHGLLVVKLPYFTPAE